MTRPDVTAASALVVDDERDLRESIAEVLEIEGYSVATASNGREALQLAAGSSPDIMLLDLMMPVMSGWEVLTAMKQDDELRTIPVIVISAHPQPPDDVAVIAKPFRIEQLLGAVERMARHRPAN